MKKLLAMIFMLFSSFACASTTSFYVYGGGGIQQQCEVPFGGGECIQYYYTDQGGMGLYVNGQWFSGVFNGASTQLDVAQQIATQISNGLGVAVTVVDVSETGYGMRVDIDGTYTLSGFEVMETSSTWLAWYGASWWQISSAQ